VPKVSEGFPRKYVNAKEIGPRVLRLTIERVIVEQVLRDRRWVIYFVGAKKGLILNRTNAEYLARELGDDSDTWLGRAVDLFTEQVDYEGEIVDGIRVALPKPPARDGSESEHEEIPF